MPLYGEWHPCSCVSASPKPHENPRHWPGEGGGLAWWQGAGKTAPQRCAAAPSHRRDAWATGVRAAEGWSGGVLQVDESLPN